MHNVAVTGLNAGDTPAPGVAVIRCIKENPKWKGRIIGLAYDALEPGVLDRNMVNNAYLLPYPSSGKDVFIERIKYIHSKEKLDVIIPTLDSELLNFINSKEELEELGIKVFIPSREQLVKRDKINLMEFADKLKIKTPKFQLVTEPAKFKFDKIEFPVMVKGLFYEAYYASTKDEAIYYVQKISSKWGYPVIIQEFIKGDEINACAVGDGTGKMAGYMCIKKVVLTDKGKGWACISIKNDEMFKFCKKIVSDLNWAGGMEIEALISKKDGNLYLIELNPRFPAWIYISKASGINLPYMHLKLALGQKVKTKYTYEAGVVVTNYTQNITTRLSSIDSLLTIGEVNYEKAI